MYKRLLNKVTNHQTHWVGDGFFVRSIFSYNTLGQQISPFLLMDYAAPREFSPTQHRRGVGEHPHRGFETVTICYAGEVEHRDSAGGGGIIHAGDVQWMTAASGLVHEEFHSQAFAKSGGQFEMVQLWVNLPAKFKMASPRYQPLKSESIPTIQLSNNQGVIRIIAGQYENSKGPALTYSPINIWDIQFNDQTELILKTPENQTCSIFVLSGKLEVDENSFIEQAEIGLFETTKDKLKIKAHGPCKILFLGGEALNEPICGYGPFVMNTPEEIRQAFSDYQEGKLGTLEKIQGSE
jgi:redox-sensitive bicupin YhaK (pirin superfamily)